MSTYYGFKSSNASEQPAWFHTADAALAFAEACGFTIRDEGESAAHDIERELTLDDLDVTTEPDESDIMDNVRISDGANVNKP